MKKIAILRGINVSGKNKIKMADLKASLEKLGFKNVISYIQSGNLVFESDFKNKELETKIEQDILNTFGLEVPVIVFSSDWLEKVIRENPYTEDQEKDSQFFHLTILKEETEVIYFEKINQKKSSNEEVNISSKVVYLYCPDGYGKTKLNNNFLEKELKVQATTRNWKTTLKLAELANNS